MSSLSFFVKDNKVYLPYRTKVLRFSREGIVIWTEDGKVEIPLPKVLGEELAYCLLRTLMEKWKLKIEQYRGNVEYHRNVANEDYENLSEERLVSATDEEEAERMVEERLNSIREEINFHHDKAEHYSRLERGYMRLTTAAEYLMHVLEEVIKLERGEDRND